MNAQIKRLESLPLAMLVSAQQVAPEELAAFSLAQVAAEVEEHLLQYPVRVERAALVE
jgi:hypothetical protein